MSRQRSSRRLALLGVTLLGAALITPGHSLQVTPIPALPPRPAPAPTPASPAPLPELQPVTPTQPALVPVLTPTAPAVTPAAPTSARPPTAVRPTDPLFARQWNLQAIGMPAAWAQLPAGKAWGPQVTVAVLDTGYSPNPELAGRVVSGYDFVSDAARAGDGDGRDRDASAVGQFGYHAEGIANLIGAAHDGRGMAGINPQARVVQVRVGGTDGLIAVPDLVDALKWSAGLTVPGVPANPNPARLLNLSLYADFIPLTGCDPRVQAAVDAVTARGALVIAGAANDGKDAAGYSPAGCRNVLTVTSVTTGGQRPAYANWGRVVALGAPGGEPGHGIPVSSVSGPGGERSPDGTSFAAPHATGVASLLLTVRPRLSPAQLRDLLTRTAAPYPAGRCDPDPVRTCGAGQLNAAAALRAALSSTLGR
ncbi:S8 family serine peptidase [Deinococcus hohokamensis]|uniref:S8 family serine peptidase n=1 Tax=Deinococcus hohokamensis TaxID=309883 RepID=A0ABV9I9A5_9DEIO